MKKKMKKKILFVRANSTSPRVIKEALSLGKQNYDVSLLLWNRIDYSSKTYRKENVTVIEYGFRAPYGNKVIFYWIIWWFEIFRYILRNDFDIVHVCGLDSYIPVILSKYIMRHKIVYDIFDFLGDSLPAGTPNIFRKFVGFFEKVLSQFADRIIIVDECRRDQIGNIDNSKIEIVMNCVDDRYPQDVGKYPNEQFTIFYGGMLSKNRGLIQIINILKRNDNITLIVAGSGEDEKELISRFQSADNVKYIGQIAHEKALELTYLSDVIFAFYNPEIPINRLASGNKLFEAMMCRTPILVNEETSMASIVQEEQCGLILPYCDEVKLEKAILRLYYNHKLCKKLGENGRMAFEKKYNWTIMEKRLFSVYSNICTNNPSGEKDD